MARASRKGGKGGGGGGRKPSPAWVWMVAGLTVGLFIAFLVFLGTRDRSVRPVPSANPASPAKPKEQPVAKPAAAKEPVQTATAPATPKPAEKKPMNYDFYKKLPKFEVEVPEAKNGARPKPLSDPGSYVLQAGSFRSPGEADARKAQLALLGIVSSVQVVNVDGKAAYHRVRVGPYRDLDRLNQVRQTLRENHIDFVTLRERS